MTNIEKLIPVHVRQIWPKEDDDFTPWLYEHPEILGDVLGTELFPQAMEAQVGRYSADLLFRDSSDRLVLVECMYGATDHDHIGKLITYSAGFDPGVAVLIAEEFRDEHRSALDWLNRESRSDFAFFGLILEAWRIGNSDPAPRLRVDTQPDNWSRMVRSAASESPTAQLYRRFWGELLPHLHQAQPHWSRVVTPAKDSVMSFGSARSDLFKYNPTFFAKPRHGCRVDAYIYSRNVEPSDVFDWLYERKSEIEAEIDQEVEWDRMDGNRGSRISVYFPNEVRVAEEYRWAEIIGWIVDTMSQAKEAFDPVIGSYPD